jgi:hypothetical protein
MYDFLRWRALRLYVCNGRHIQWVAISGLNPVYSFFFYKCSSRLCPCDVLRFCHWSVYCNGRMTLEPFRSLWLVTSDVLVYLLRRAGYVRAPRVDCVVFGGPRREHGDGSTGRVGELKSAEELGCGACPVHLKNAAFLVEAQRNAFANSGELRLLLLSWTGTYGCLEASRSWFRSTTCCGERRVYRWA